MFPDGTACRTRRRARCSSTAPPARSTSVGPGGDLYYADVDGGTIRRVRASTPNQAPTARVTATPTSGPAPLTVQFDAHGSTDPDGDALPTRGTSTATAPTTTRRPTPDAHVHRTGNSPSRLRVTDPRRLSATRRSRSRSARRRRATIATPAAGTTWSGGRPIVASPARRRRAGQRRARRGLRVDARPAPLLGARPDELPRAPHPELRRRGVRLVRRTRPRVPVVPRARADRHRRVRPDAAASRAGSTRRPSTLTFDTVPVRPALVGRRRGSAAPFTRTVSRARPWARRAAEQQSSAGAPTTSPRGRTAAPPRHQFTAPDHAGDVRRHLHRGRARPRRPGRRLGLRRDHRRHRASTRRAAATPARSAARPAWPPGASARR